MNTKKVYIYFFYVHILIFYKKWTRNTDWHSVFLVQWTAFVVHFSISRVHISIWHVHFSILRRKNFFCWSTNLLNLHQYLDNFFMKKIFNVYIADFTRCIHSRLLYCVSFDQFLDLYFNQFWSQILITFWTSF